jgi:hypothetical protein
LRIFSASPTKLQSNYRNAQQEVFFHHPARPFFEGACRNVEHPPILLEALRGIEWVKLVFPDVNMLVRVNVNVPEKEWSHALKAK